MLIYEHGKHQIGSHQKKQKREKRNKEAMLPFYVPKMQNASVIPFLRPGHELHFILHWLFVNVRTFLFLHIFFLLFPHKG